MELPKHLSNFIITNVGIGSFYYNDELNRGIAVRKDLGNMTNICFIDGPKKKLRKNIPDIAINFMLFSGI